MTCFASVRRVVSRTAAASCTACADSRAPFFPVRGTNGRVVPFVHSAARSSAVAPRPPRAMQRLRAAASACRRGLTAASAEASPFPPPWARHAHAAAAPEVKKGARLRSERRAPRRALTPRQNAQAALRQSQTRETCCCCRRCRGPQRGASRRPRSASRAEYPPWYSTRCAYATGTRMRRCCALRRRSAEPEPRATPPAVRPRQAAGHAQLA